MSEKPKYVPPEALQENNGPVKGSKPIEGLPDNLEFDSGEPKTKVQNDKGEWVEADDGPVTGWKPIEGLPAIEKE